MSAEHPCSTRLLVTLLWSLLTIGSPSMATTENETNMIYDQETGQYFPISELSKREDPFILLPDPDPEEFPPDYLESLLVHCDDPIPGAWEFLQKAWIAFSEFGLNWSRYPVSRRMVSRIYNAIRPVQILHAVILAVILSVARYMLQRYLLEPTKQRLGITTRNTQRLFESSWKAFWFLTMWLCTFYALILKGRTDFQYPLRIFKGLKVEIGYFDIPTPPDYYRIYTLQLGFYLHSLWSVVCIDAWRKDSSVLIMHHVMTLLLLEFSLTLRLHRIGALVVFLHDLNDVFLELAKVNVYLRVRHGRLCLINVVLSNVFFVLFASSWIVMRLYWFPLKVLYATSWGLYITNVGRECRTILFFNSMLWALFLMHIYWFRLIFIMAVRMFTSRVCNDIREEEADDEVPMTKDATTAVSDSQENGTNPNRIQVNGIAKTKLHKTNNISNGDANHLRRR